ncbi:carbohydrate esterase family 1 protein [Hypholoma sublateritium FD-334 SS-4]|uniref:Carbohydrate esterase family 1 protein n=1 Tax=Hypholoma sublateritium (strain FD-334 SS-4) TaxID=945553 RepID=A0A0D2N9E9_HYPSF|nr:carbohydrate esterase family 1 protein [Hypholoma sublateritium FD-334 SS-4]
MHYSGTAPGGCWDVNTNATLTHNEGSNSLAIANVARCFISNMGVDSTRVFATGTSSGAMMTNVLMGAYPISLPLDPCTLVFPTDASEDPTLGTQWGDLVRSGYPGFTGVRPKIQFWHRTVDTTLYPQNFWEEIKQWTNVFEVSATPVTAILK